MDVINHIMILCVIFFIICAVPYVYADSSNIFWKITIKTNLGVNSTSFWPPEIHARQNDTVQWINNDTTVHTITSGVSTHPAYNGKIFDHTVNPGESYSLKIPAHEWTAYYYFCKIHPWMIGKIDVGVAYLGISPDFSVETDKEIYSDMDTVRIFGIVNNTYQITPVTIQIFDNQRNLVFLDKTNLLQDHSFLYELKATSSIFKNDGNYKIKTYYGFPSTITDVNIFFNNTQSSASYSYHIPHYIKNNSRWWSEGEITDNDFINGIQFLIKNKHITIHPTNTSKVSSHLIPIWVKNNARNWASNTTTDDEFASSISYLIDHNIIQV
jgi:plastocyanin